MTGLFRPNVQIAIRHRNRKKNHKLTIKRGGDLEIASSNVCGLKATSGCEINEFQLEACRKAIQNSLKRRGIVVCRIFPNACKGSKPVESRMGKGAAAPSVYYIKVAPGTIIWEIGGVSVEDAEKALELARVRLPCTSKIVYSKNYHTT